MTMRHHLDSRLGARVDHNSALIERLIAWTADILSKYTVHENGRTSYKMGTQHTFQHKVIAFVETVYVQLKM